MEELLYQKIARLIEQQIRNAVWTNGEKLPSLRTICQEYGVSMNTALQAYFMLEKKGWIETRPQSGYYVTFRPQYTLPVPSTSSPELIHGKENIEEIIDSVANNRKQTRIAFSSGTPAPELLPVAKLNKAMLQAMRNLPDSGIGYDYHGNEKLKTQIARRSAIWGGKLQPDDILPTSGSMDAIAFCMMSLAGSGDTIAVESPTYFGILQLARSLGIKVIELPTNPITGVEMDVLKKVLSTRKIKLCILVSNFSNPLGSCMPDEHKKEVVRLMEHYQVPLIEDDLYGDLYFGSQRPSTCKTFDESGIVMWCGSFSKTLTAGYRVGWVAPGKFMEKVNRAKRYHSVATNTLAHEAVGWFLENGRYDSHLKKLRQSLYTNLQRYLGCIGAHFPEGTRVSQPQGGFILWLELNEKLSALKLYDKAIRHHISISPGTMYTLQKQYHNCFRISFGLVWNDKVEAALRQLGKLSSEL